MRYSFRNSFSTLNGFLAQSFQRRRGANTIAPKTKCHTINCIYLSIFCHLYARYPPSICKPFAEQTHTQNMPHVFGLIFNRTHSLSLGTRKRTCTHPESSRENFADFGQPALLLFIFCGWVGQDFVCRLWKRSGSIILRPSINYENE